MPSSARPAGWWGPDDPGYDGPVTQTAPADAPEEERTVTILRARVEEDPRCAGRLSRIALDVRIGRYAPLGLYDIIVPLTDGSSATLREQLHIMAIEILTRNEKGETIPLPVPFVNCVPVPTVSAEVEEASMDDRVVTLRIKGKVADETSGVVANPANRVRNLNVLINERAANTIPLIGTALPEPPWRPYKFEADYSTIVRFRASRPGGYVVALETDENAAGNSGEGYVTVKVGGDSEYWTSLNIVLAGSLLPDRVDSIRFYTSERDPGPGDPVLTETGPGTKVFRGRAGDTTVSAEIRAFSGLTQAADEMTVLFAFGPPEERACTLEVKMRETAGESGRFAYGEAKAVSGPGKLLVGGSHVSADLNLLLSADLDPTGRDTIILGFGDDPDKVYGAVSLVETGVASRIFEGTQGDAEVRVSIEELASLTGAPDSVAARFEFAYSDGSVASRRVVLRETGPDTKRFLYTEVDVFIEGVDGDDGKGGGTFLPIMVRVTGDERILDAVSDLKLRMFGDWFPLEPFGDIPEGGRGRYFPVDSNGNPVVFVPAATARSDRNVKAVIDDRLVVVVTGGEATPRIPQPVVLWDAKPKEAGLFVEGKRIEPGGRPDIVAQAVINKNRLPDTAVSREALAKMIGETAGAHTYPDWNVLRTELELREATVRAAQNYRVAFARESSELSANEKYWGPPNDYVALLKAKRKIVRLSSGEQKAVEDWQEGIKEALDDIYRDNPGKYRFDCAMAAGCINLKAAVDFAVARGQDPDELFAGYYKDKSTRVAIVGPSDWKAWEKEGDKEPEEKIYNRRMKLWRLYRESLIPGDWFQTYQRNWIYLGGDIAFTADKGIVTLEVARSFGRIGPKRYVLEPIFFTKLAAER
ncbi:MAG: hypothetical protein N3A38_04225 [Planctomycetota bacterium]|nr:hypothetical protein [Planctomycetota bacterium]